MTHRLRLRSTAAHDGHQAAEASAASVAKGPGRRNWSVKLIVAVLCLLWIVPTLGIFVTSLRPLDDANSSGWWTVFTNPSTSGHCTPSNYTGRARQREPRPRRSSTASRSPCRPPSSRS